MESLQQGYFVPARQIFSVKKLQKKLSNTISFILMVTLLKTNSAVEFTVIQAKARMRIIFSEKKSWNPQYSHLKTSDLNRSD